MAKKLGTLRDKLPSAARARAQARATEMLAEMALPELRRALDVSQEDLAKVLNVSQASVSKMENRSDLHVTASRHTSRRSAASLSWLHIFRRGRQARTSYA